MDPSNSKQRLAILGVRAQSGQHWSGWPLAPFWMGRAIDRANWAQTCCSSSQYRFAVSSGVEAFSDPPAFLACGLNRFCDQGSHFCYFPPRFFDVPLKASISLEFFFYLSMRFFSVLANVFSILAQATWHGSTVNFSSTVASTVHVGSSLHYVCFVLPAPGIPRTWVHMGPGDTRDPGICSWGQDHIPGARVYASWSRVHPGAGYTLVSCTLPA